MSKASRKDLYPAVIDALAGASYTENLMRLTCGQLERQEFSQIKEVAEIIRGQWVGGKKQGFVFPDEIDPEIIMWDIISKGRMPPKNQYSLFSTPKSVIDIMINDLIGDEIDWIEQPKILEPSAGLGGIALALQERYQNGTVTAVEIDEINVKMMSKKGIDAIHSDFLKTSWVEEFDLVVMNPPFDGTTCAHHFLHAYKAMKRNGMIVCILPSEVARRATSAKPVADMMNLINRNGGIEELPERSFSPQTNVSTFVAYIKGKGSGRSGANYVAMALLPVIDADYDTYLKINRIFEKGGISLETNLIGEVMPNKFTDQIDQIVKGFMEKNPQNFLLLSDEEKKEVYEHYCSAFADSIYAGNRDRKEATQQPIQ